ncbi:hypothetical protein E4U55_006232 [Claviceps digitariae]|nr:hypothetical protein E4U55_006232 [Claviceps digitariae]
MTSTPPLMPEHPALTNDNSMLTRRFGKEVINYFAGSRLNRYSFLRSDAAFLNRAATSPHARYIALDDLSPLVVDKKKLALLSYQDVKAVLGPNPAFLQSDAERIKAFDSSKVASETQVVFLGTTTATATATTTTKAGTTNGAAESGEEGELVWESSEHGEVKGRPFFAVDVSTARGGRTAEKKAWLRSQEEKGLWIAVDTRSLKLHSEAASMFAQARSIIDWNTRHRFCAGCGHANLSIQAGYKRVCPATDLKDAPPGSDTGLDQEDCPTRHGVSNICFPRTDPTMIAAVVSSDGKRMLLGRQSRWPPHWHSNLAGFLEPGESIEEAVRREVWEEAGVRVGRVQVHSTQPWPYPSSLMIGAIAEALPGDGETITLNDKELESAAWFPVEEVAAALAQARSQTGGGRTAPPPEGYKEGDLRVPPATAIANRLMTAVVEGYLTGNAKM